MPDRCMWYVLKSENFNWNFNISTLLSIKLLHSLTQMVVFSRDLALLGLQTMFDAKAWTLVQGR